MSWSYFPSLLASSSKDAVRLLIGDVLSTDQQMQDEEINYILTRRSTVYGAAADCCRSLAAKFSRSVDQQAGTSKIAYSQLAKSYTMKAIEYEQKATLAGAGTPYMGGISVSDKTSQDQNTDRPPTQFNLGMTDNLIPEASQANETMQDNNDSLTGQ
jgi:hypothetical protein